MTGEELAADEGRRCRQATEDDRRHKLGIFSPMHGAPAGKWLDPAVVALVEEARQRRAAGEPVEPEAPRHSHASVTAYPDGRREWGDGCPLPPASWASGEGETGAAAARAVVSQSDGASPATPKRRRRRMASVTVIPYRR